MKNIIEERWFCDRHLHYLFFKPKQNSPVYTSTPKWRAA